jgi:hypothetical protein
MSVLARDHLYVLTVVLLADEVVLSGILVLLYLYVVFQYSDNCCTDFFDYESYSLSGTFKKMLQACKRITRSIKT